MSILAQVLQEISAEEKRAGEQQCFISHEFSQLDLRAKLERALGRLGLEAYFADHEVTGEFILTKVCRKILSTRASIVDLSKASPNVYFELGAAIGLNKPIFVVLRSGIPVPPLLDRFVKLRFSSFAALEQDLAEQVPAWLEESIEHHLRYTTHCHFVNVLCPDRQRFSPRRQFLVLDEIESIDEAGQSCRIVDPDMRAELLPALERFDFAPRFLDQVPSGEGFRLCDYCRALRDSDFALGHLARQTTTNVYLLLGLVTGLVELPSLLLVREPAEPGAPEVRVPAVLLGLDAFHYRHLVEIGERLGSAVDGFLHRHKSRPIPKRVLLLPEWGGVVVEEEREADDAAEPPAVEPAGARPEVLETLRAILIDLMFVEDGPPITASTRLVEDLEMDELDLVEFIMAVEEEFDLEIADNDPLVFSSEPADSMLDQLLLRTVQGWADYLAGRPAEAPRPAESKGPDLRDWLAEIEALEDPAERAAAIVELAPALAEAGDAAGLRQAIALARAIGEAELQVEAWDVVVAAVIALGERDILRLGTEMALAAGPPLRDALLASLAHGYIELDDRERAEAVAGLIEDPSIAGQVREVLAQHAADVPTSFGPGTPFQAPPLPPNYVAQPAAFSTLKQQLLAAVPFPSTLAINSIHGMGGSGKSILAAALAHDPEVQDRFSDGVLWVTLGQQPDLLSLQMGWIQALGDYNLHPTTSEAAASHLRTLLHDKACLLVVDDAWKLEQVQPFLAGGPRCSTLITTRQADLGGMLGAFSYTLDVMTPEQALELFGNHLRRPIEGTERQVALKVAQAAGYLPLALALVAAQVARGRSWDDLFNLIGDETDPDRLIQVLGTS